MSAQKRPLSVGVQARIRCLTPRIHMLGPNPLYHLFTDLARGGDLMETLEQYARLPGRHTMPLSGLLDLIDAVGHQPP